MYIVCYPFISITKAKETRSCCDEQAILIISQLVIPRLTIAFAYSATSTLLVHFREIALLSAIKILKQ